MKTRGRLGRVIFIVLSALQALKNNERRAVNSRVYSIVLKCLETLVKHKPRVYVITTLVVHDINLFHFSVREYSGKKF